MDNTLPPLPDILIDVPPSPKFKIGDVVRLNSGGPAMTVTCVDSDRVTCAWFDEAIYRDGTFHPACLTPDGPCFSPLPAVP